MMSSCSPSSFPYFPGLARLMRTVLRRSQSGKIPGKSSCTACGRYGEMLGEMPNLFQAYVAQVSGGAP
ncbi:hypothetical protein EON65_35845 [archaeon]|nr:MAG: hypothetical protein EON65_35845 [archaeon]